VILFAVMLYHPGSIVKGLTGQKRKLEESDYYPCLNYNSGYFLNFEFWLDYFFKWEKN
jgi:hypothetical protein